MSFNLFAYGTLRSGHAESARLTGCVRTGDGVVRGTLYDIDGQYPALMPYGTDAIHGEVWRCPADLLPELDAYENIASGLFRRIGMEVEGAGDAAIPCWVYVAGPRLARMLTPERRTAGASWRPAAQGVRP